MLGWKVCNPIKCLVRVLSAPRSAEITTPLGVIKGRVVTSPTGRDVEEYLGIPFAQPPLGELRYANPVPLEKLPNGKRDVQTTVAASSNALCWMCNTWYLRVIFPGFNDLFVYARTDADPERACEFGMQLFVHTQINRWTSAITLHTLYTC